MLPSSDTCLRAGADCRGSILISLLLVMCLTVLTFSSMIVGSVEWSLANNSLNQAQALALAESGVEHAMLAITQADADLDSLLAGTDGNRDTGDDGLIIGAAAVSVGSRGGSYTAVIVDNDDGDNDTSTDSDGRYHLLATGEFKGVRQTVRVVLEVGAGGAWTPPYGILANNDVTIDAGVQLIGPLSSVFSNEDVEVNNYRLDGGVWSADDVDIRSSDPEIQGSVLDGEQIDDYELAHGEHPPTGIRRVDPTECAPYADYTLSSDGTIHRSDGTLEFDASGGDPWGHWRYVGGGDWLLDGPTSIDAGAFFVEGSVKVAGSGGTAGAPIELSLFTEGSVEFAGDFYLSARYGGLLAVTGGDVAVNGVSEYRGSLVVHEQLRMQGTSTLRGVVVVEDAADDFDLLDRRSEGTHITGITTIWPDPDTELPIWGGGGSLRAIEWREEQ